VKDGEIKKVNLGEAELKEGECAETLFEGKIIIQNRSLYRFTSDSILLSRFASAKRGDAVADFCAGCGVVGFHFLCLNPDIKSLTLFELQPSLCDMAARTAKADSFEVKIVEGRIQDIPPEYDGAFSLILCNPPYERGGLENVSYERAICRKEITVTLEDIIKASSKKLKFGGRLAMCHRADRLAEVIYTMKKYNIEAKKLQFVCGARGASPYLVMVEGVKGGKPCLTVLPELVNTPQNGGGTL